LTGSTSEKLMKVMLEELVWRAPKFIVGEIAQLKRVSK
jgi:hypothetical protein